MEIQIGENKAAYIGKMGRQIQEVGSHITQLERISAERRARDNAEVRRQLSDARLQLDTVARLFEALKQEAGEMWPEGSIELSSAYKQIEVQLGKLDSLVKPK